VELFYKKVQPGFTLIELMIVIIGILAATAKSCSPYFGNKVFFEVLCCP
jgi:prepilin-type N-terminal cleavage/methylation domain-containing protein